MSTENNKPVILFVRGCNDRHIARVLTDDTGNATYFIDGGANVFPFIKSENFTSLRTTVVPNKAGKVRMTKPAVIFNEISEPETHHNSMVLASGIQAQFPQIPVINPIDNIRKSDRETVSRTLARLPGITCPRTVKLTPESRDQFCSLVASHFNKVEVLIRECGAHGGETMIRWQADMSPSRLDVYAIDGRSFYVTEFNDFISEDGHYRKYRVAVVDGEPFIRHVIASDSWNIHAGSRESTVKKFPALQQQEEELIVNFEDVLKPVLEKPVAAIHKALELDYFGIDFAMDSQQQMIIFEANANMNILINTVPTPNIFETAINRITDAIQQMIEHRLQADSHP